MSPTTYLGEFEQAAYDARTFDSIMADALAQQRFSVTLFAAFAGLALALAAVGLYGVMTHVVAGRTHEMGVRLALGARPSQVRRLVVRQGMDLLVMGLAVGVPAALGSAHLLGALLYGVKPGDPVTLGVVIALIGGSPGCRPGCRPGAPPGSTRPQS